MVLLLDSQVCTPSNYFRIKNNENKFKNSTFQFVLTPIVSDEHTNQIPHIPKIKTTISITYQIQSWVQEREIRLLTRTQTWSELHQSPKVSSDKSLDAHQFRKVALSPPPGIDETVPSKRTSVENLAAKLHQKQDQTHEQEHKYIYINLDEKKKIPYRILRKNSTEFTTQQSMKQVSGKARK